MKIFVSELHNLKLQTEDKKEPTKQDVKRKSRIKKFVPVPSMIMTKGREPPADVPTYSP